MTVVADIGTLPQNFTASWVDLGTEQSTSSAQTATLFLGLEVNDSLNMRIRALGMHATGGTEFMMPIKTVTATQVDTEGEFIEFSQDVDQNIIISFSLSGTIPFVQFQIQAGTVGGTAGQVVEANLITL